MEKWARINYQPCIPMGGNNSKITGSKKHIELSRRAAGEGTVLLKNDEHVLPLKKGSKVVIFGKAQIDYVKGGGGSGDVFCDYVTNIYEGLKQKNDRIDVFDAVSLYYKEYVLNAYKNGGKNGMLEETTIPTHLIDVAKEFTDTAIITINRYSAEEADRFNDGKDAYFVLSQQEQEMVDSVCANFKKVIVLLNTGSMIDTSWFSHNDKIQAAVMIWQGGMEGGLATADILVGDVNPSGKLVDTCARNFGDYPSSEGFHESEDYVKYVEDIFVGYRYFETIPNKKDCVIYPFGYGLSYTTFKISNYFICMLNEKLLVSVDVKNTGECAGKEVVQVYYNPPVGKITKPKLILSAFAKTSELKPGETETIIITFDISSMTSYDDLGVIKKAAWVIEKGDYRFFVGNSVRNVYKLDFIYSLSEDLVIEQCHTYCTPKNLEKRLTETGEYMMVEEKRNVEEKFKCDYICNENIPQKEDDIKYLIDVYNGEVSLDEFVKQLTDEEMISMLKGQWSTGVADTGGMGNLKKYGIPNPMTADGPAGIRIKPDRGVKTTAFPIATMLACTWNTDILEKVGVAGALEAKENNLSIWLTPALNIHRSPLCGRNFEYYSEDPLVSGKMAAAMVRGIQSQNIAATPKHFACNNKETNRMESDSVVSERALREIYLKGFEICIREAKPRLIMTSYNLINGIRASENTELIMGILRGEWGYDGLVISDWWNHASHAKEVLAGNDIRMPIEAGSDLEEKYLNGEVSRSQMAICVKRLLEMILWLE